MDFVKYDTKMIVIDGDNTSVFTAEDIEKYGKGDYSSLFYKI